MNTLVRRAKKGDRAAFTELLFSQEARLYRIAATILKNEEDASDALQETALSCWENIETLQKEEFFQTWVTRILINRCNDILRKRKRFAESGVMTEVGKLDRSLAEAEWYLALNEIDEKYRVVLILYYADGFKVREIAEILSLNENTVKERLASARKQYERRVLLADGEVG